MLHWIRDRLADLFRLRESEHLEEILKHLSEAERTCVRVSLHGVAGRLGFSPARVADLLSHLTRTGLVTIEGEDCRLTDEGRSRALRLQRAHRLWERCLADRTGVSPEEWHAGAERMEHLPGPDRALVRGREVTLEPAMAGNVTVEPAPAGD